MSLLSYAIIYHTYKHPITGILRIIFVLFILFLIVSGFYQGILPKGPLFFFSFFVISEVLFRYKVMRTIPKITVAQNNGKDIDESFTFQALDIFMFSHDSVSMMNELIKKAHVRFIMQKANIGKEDLPKVVVNKEEIAKKAFELVKDLNGSFITRMDLFVAYLLLIEPETKYLFNKHLKPNDLLYILYWARYEYPFEEHPQKMQVVFWGTGIGEDWTTGWTLETKKYITDLTYKVLDEKPALVGRRKEYEQLVATLSKPTHNNALLIGETGSGKTSLVDAVALNSYLGLIPGKLYHKHVYQLMIGLLVAGVKDVGELEARIEAILGELEHAGNIILYIPDVEHILGSTTFNLDLSGVLSNFLKDSHLPIIATVSPGAFRKFVESRSGFREFFEEIRIDEPTEEEAIQMLLEKANEIGEKNHVTITFKAVVAVVQMAKRYLQDRSLPGSAVSLLTSVANNISLAHKSVVDEDDVIAKVEQQTRVAISKPGQEEKELLLHLEDKLHERIIGQEEAVNAIAQAIRRLRSGLTSQTRPISFLFLGPTGVGKTETAKALATVYFGGEDKTIRLDMSEYNGPGAVDRLLGSPPGLGDEKGELTEKVYENPFSLILLDEFEKASTEVLDLFLQILEDGRLTDNHGKRVSFANTIIIATSNAGALYIQNELLAGKQISAVFQQGLLMELEQEHIFKPELINRFDGIIVFKPLTAANVEQIAKLFLTEMQKKLQAQDVTVSFGDDVIKAAASAGFDQQFGARPLRRFIQDKIEDLLSQGMLRGNVERGSSIRLVVDGSGNIAIAS